MEIQLFSVNVEHIIGIILILYIVLNGYFLYLIGGIPSTTI